MKVLLTLSSGRRGGAELHVAWLARGLAARGLGVGVALRPGPVADELAGAGVAVHRLGFGDGLDPWTPCALGRLARGYDVLHAHMNRAALYTRLGAWLAGRPWLATAHGMTRGLYYRGAARVIAVSQAVADHLRTQGVARVVVVPNGVPAPAPADPAGVAGWKARIGAGPGRVVALVLANNHPNKGADLALQALARLPTGFRLVLAGEGVDGEALGGRCRELGVADRVVRSGPVERVGELFEAVDLVLVPSQREAFSLVALEARLRGRPVLASDVDGLAEVVPDGTGGCLRIRGRDPARWAAALQAAGARLPVLREQARRAVPGVELAFDAEAWMGRTADVIRSVVREARA